MNEKFLLAASLDRIMDEVEAVPGDSSFDAMIQRVLYGSHAQQLENAKLASLHSTQEGEI